MTLKKYLKAKERHDSLQREHDRLEGALTQLEERLRSELGVDSIDKAERLLEKLEQESKEIAAKHQRAEERFNRKWKGRLE